MTMTNAEWILKEGIPFKNIKTIQHNPKETRWYEIAVNGKVVDKIVSKLEPADLFRKWLDAEHIDPILDDAEREYLSAVIRPFRDKVLSIKKSSGLLYASHHFDEIYVYYESFGHDLCFDLPPFEKGTMYKGMKPNQKYTPEELGL